jgi:hypothetical protein
LCTPCPKTGQDPPDPPTHPPLDPQCSNPTWTKRVKQVQKSAPHTNQEKRTMLVQVLVTQMEQKGPMSSGGCMKHNFWTACLLPHTNYIFRILRLRAIDWYIYGSNQGGGGVGWSPDKFLVFLQGVSSFFWGIFTKF